MDSKKVLEIITILAIAFIGLSILTNTPQTQTKTISTFEECVAAGNIPIKTLPPQCQTPDGRIFVQGDQCPFIDCTPDRPICKNNQCVAISSFQECAAAGYPIMKSYPEQCRAPNGQTFTRKISSGCEGNVECTQGYFCKLGLCTEFSPDTSCQTNDDCQLIDITNRFSCCYVGYCDTIDYSNSKWVAVNSQWFNENSITYCPTKEECGPQPGCPTQIVNENYHAVCQNNICEKKAKVISFSCHVASQYSTASGLAETIEQRCQQKSTQTECLSDVQCQWV